MLIRHGAPVLERAHRRQLRQPRRRPQRRSRHLRVLPAVDRLRHVPVVGHRRRRRRRRVPGAEDAARRARPLRAGLGRSSTSPPSRWSTPSSTTTRCRRCPALAILAALFLDDVLTRAASAGTRSRSALVALPLTFACGARSGGLSAALLVDVRLRLRDRARHRPSVAVGDDLRHALRVRLAPAGARHRAAVAALIALIAAVARGRGVAATPDDPDAPRRRRERRPCARARRRRSSSRWSSASPPGRRRHTARRRRCRRGCGWCRRVPMLVALGFCSARSVRVGRAAAARRSSARSTARFLLDRYLPDLGPHWSQKHVIAAYYAQSQRPRGAAHRLQPLLARRELLHAQRDLLAADGAGEVGLGRAAERQAARRGSSATRGSASSSSSSATASSRCAASCPSASRADVKIVDDSNNKLILVEVRI